MKKWIALLIVLPLLFFAGVSVAQTVTGFMKVPSIPGDSNSEGHENEIRLFAVTQHFDASVRTTNPCVVTIAKPLDKAGPLLFVAAVTGQNLGSVKIDLVVSGAEATNTFYTIFLTNTRVVAITSTPHSLVENLTMMGDSITLTFEPRTGPTGSKVVGTASCR